MQEFNAIAFRLFELGNLSDDIAEICQTCEKSTPADIFFDTIWKDAQLETKGLKVFVVVFVVFVVGWKTLILLIA